MYAVLANIKVKPEFGAEEPKVIQQFVALHKAQKGFKSQTFLMKEESTERVVLSLWETKEDVDAELAVCLPELKKASSMFVSEPTLQVYKVDYKD